MIYKMNAVYRAGAFYPEANCSLPDESHVQLTVESQQLADDVAERKQRLLELIGRMQRNPLPATAPKLTRDELHERS